jgi:uncharacterized protein YutE (UPF0331/DUF86 family)
MSPEVIFRKLAAIGRYLEDLSAHRHDAFEQFMAEHYKIERLIELLVMCASDIAFHVLSLKGELPPDSYRAAFLRLGEMGILEAQLSMNLALGAGLRNILAHEYEEIDYRLLHESICRILNDLARFAAAVSAMQFESNDI